MGATCAVSLCNIGYEALTNYRNGEIGGCERFTAEILYLGLTLGGALETTARAAVAVAMQGAFFVGCFIPFDCMDQPLLDLQNIYYVWVKDSVLTCATATAASALSLKNNLTTTGEVDFEAQRQTVEKCARKHLASKVDANTGKINPATPFSLAVLKALTHWRNDFLDGNGKVVTSIKCFKKIVAIPLYLGVALLSTLEAVARTAYIVGFVLLCHHATLYSLLAAGFATAKVGGYAISAISAITPLSMVPSLVAFSAGALGYLTVMSLIYYVPRRLVSQGFPLVQHILSATAGVGYTGTITSAAALTCLKDNLMNNSRRVSELGLVDYKRQIQHLLDVTEMCFIMPLLVPILLGMAVGVTIIRLLIEPFLAFFNQGLSIPAFCTTLGNNLYLTGADAVKYGAIGFNAADQASQEVVNFISECFSPSTYA
jgi:hypothetical protein